MPAVEMRGRIHYLTLRGLKLIPVGCAILLHHRVAEQIVQCVRERDAPLSCELVSIYRLSQHRADLLTRRFFGKSENRHVEQQAEDKQFQQ